MKHTIYEAVRWLAAALAVLLLVLLGTQGRSSDTPMAAMEQAVCQALELGQMQKADNQMIKRLYGLQPAEFEDCVLYYPETNMDAEELLLVRLRDSGQQQAVQDAIARRLETQKQSFDGYGVAQYDLLTNHAVIEVQGNYILFVVSAQAEQARQAFLGAL